MSLSFALMCLAASPAFTNLDAGTPPGDRRSTGGAIRGSATANDEFVGYGGFNSAGNVLEISRYLMTTNAWSTSAATVARERHGFAYDPVHDVFVVAGGASGLTLYDTVLLINGGTLTVSAPPSPAIRPSARIDPLIQWIPAWGKFLYFGGRTSVFSNQHVGDQWMLDVADGGVTWAAATAPGAPSARGAVCSGFDPILERLYLFAGEGTSALSDTWSFGADAGWSQLTVSGTPPSARSFAACAWDSSIRQLVLYGGQTSTQVGGLFTFNPATNVWTSWPVSPNPGNLSDSAAAFSRGLGGTILFGGQTASATYSNTTWLLRFNNPPQVDAGPNFSIGENVLTALSGSVVDPEFAPTTASWVQTNGPMVTLSDPSVLNPSFTTPLVSGPTVLRFVLTGSDGLDTATDDMNVTVLNSINGKPFADAGPDQVVAEGALVTLTGGGVDPDGDPIAGYGWSQLSGPPVTLSSTDMAVISFTAPVMNSPVTLKFEFAVSDGTIVSDVDEVAVTVLRTIADAGPVDAGPVDAGAVDSGMADAGVDDAGSPDAGVEDAGSADAGSAADAGIASDAGVDEPDAGSAAVSHEYLIGCGCSGAPFSSEWLFVSLGWLLLGRRKLRRS